MHRPLSLVFVLLFVVSCGHSGSMKAKEHSRGASMGAPVPDSLPTLPLPPAPSLVPTVLFGGNAEAYPAPVPQVQHPVWMCYVRFNGTSAVRATYARAADYGSAANKTSELCATGVSQVFACFSPAELIAAGYRDAGSLINTCNGPVQNAVPLSCNFTACY